jgi:hypothetical protein
MISRSDIALAVIGLPFGLLALALVVWRMDIVMLMPFILPVMFVGCVLLGYLRAMFR